LDIITQVLGSPATFLHYIERRLAIEKTTFGVDADEMDLLGFYISQGMYFSSAEFSDITDLYLNGFSDGIDEYVYRKHDAHEDVKAPAAPVPEGFSELIVEIEGLSNLHRTDAALALLDMSGPSRKNFLEMIEKTKDSTRRDRSGHSVSMGSQEHSRGFSFITAVGEKRDEAVSEQAMSFALLKK
jgi:hypothetical protein